MPTMFTDRKLIIATMHRKEQAIAPVLEQALGVKCLTDDSLDTDELGTFTGEIERTLDPLTAAREKCLRAMHRNNCDLGVASEGSFGPHPTLFFAAAGDELLIFIDLKNKLEIIVRELSTETNFNGQAIHNWNEMHAFAQQIGFPSHALILRKAKDEPTEITKGITDLQQLKTAYELLSTKYQSVFAETDMRAMYNPTRMGVIEKAARKLADKIRSTCPQCQMPGFGITDAKTGLPCSLCGFATHRVLSYLSVCAHCGFTKENLYPHGKTAEDPMYCDVCNP